VGGVVAGTHHHVGVGRHLNQTGSLLAVAMQVAEREQLQGLQYSQAMTFRRYISPILLLALLALALLAPAAALASGPSAGDQQYVDPLGGGNGSGNGSGSGSNNGSGSSGSSTAGSTSASAGSSASSS